MVKDWISEHNIYAFLTALSWLVEYDFDLDDWCAISRGIRESDYEAGIWYDYAFVGKKRAEFRLALDSGTTVVFIELMTPSELRDRIELLMTFLTRFEASPSGPTK